MLLRCRRSIAFRRWKLSILLAGCVLLIVWWMTTTTTRLDDEHGGPTPAVNHTTGTFYNAPDVSFRPTPPPSWRNVSSIYGDSEGKLRLCSNTHGVSLSNANQAAGFGSKWRATASSTVDGITTHVVAALSTSGARRLALSLHIGGDREEAAQRHACAALLSTLPFGVRRRALVASTMPAAFSVGLLNTPPTAMGVIRLLPHTSMSPECAVADMWLQIDSTTGIFEDPHGKNTRSASLVCGGEDADAISSALHAALKDGRTSPRPIPLLAHLQDDVAYDAYVGVLSFVEHFHFNDAKLALCEVLGMLRRNIAADTLSYDQASQTHERTKVSNFYRFLWALLLDARDEYKGALDAYGAALRSAWSASHKVWPWVFKRRSVALAAEHPLLCSSDGPERDMMKRSQNSPIADKCSATKARILDPSSLPLVHMIWTRRSASANGGLSILEEASVRSIFRAYPGGVRLLVHSSTVTQETFRSVVDLADETNSQIIISNIECLWLHDNVELVWFTVFVEDIIQMYSESSHFYSHITDMARMLALYRYGGIYLDTDVILLRNLNDIDDAVGMESGSLTSPWEYVPRTELNRIVVNGAVMKFSRAESPFVLQCMQLALKRYNPTVWGSIGPDLLTHAARLLLANYEYDESLGSDRTLELGSVVILPAGAFYPFHWSKGGLHALYSSEMTSKQVNALNETYAVHMWNRLAPPPTNWHPKSSASHLLQQIGMSL